MDVFEKIEELELELGGLCARRNSERITELPVPFFRPG